MPKTIPWLTWANRTTVTIPAGIAAANPQRQSFQLVSATIGRPITWSFFFAARVVSTATGGAVNVIFVDFNVTAGIGFAKANISALPTSIAQQGFARFVFTGAPISPTAANAYKWTGTIRTPNLDDTAATPQTEAVDKLVGERIECNASVLYTLAPPNEDTVLDLFAGFAPYDHIRKEWLIEEADTTQELREMFADGGDR